MIISLPLIFHLNLFMHLLRYRLKLSLLSKPSVPTVSLSGRQKFFPQPHMEVKQHSLGTHKK